MDIQVAGLQLWECEIGPGLKEYFDSLGTGTRRNVPCMIAASDSPRSHFPTCWLTIWEYLVYLLIY